MYLTFSFYFVGADIKTSWHVVSALPMPVAGKSLPNQYVLMAFKPHINPRNVLAEEGTRELILEVGGEYVVISVFHIKSCLIQTFLFQISFDLVTH